MSIAWSIQRGAFLMLDKHGYIKPFISPKGKCYSFYTMGGICKGKLKVMPQCINCPCFMPDKLKTKH